MSRDEGEKPAAPAQGVLRSEGEDAAQAYAEAEAPQASLTPTVEMFRVHVLDPRRAPTMRREDMFKGSGPRAPEVTVLKAAAAPSVEAPLGRPANKMQPLHFDPEFLAELRRMRPVGEGEAGPEEKVGSEEKAHEGPEAAGASPWSKEAAPSEVVRGSALPSSFGPRNEDAPASEEPARTPVRERSRATMAITVALVVGAGVVVWVSTSGHTTESGSSGPAMAATMTTAVPSVREVVPPPAQPAVPEPVAPPKASATSTATAVPSSPPPHTVPKASSEPVDPYPDVVVKPIPTATVAPSAVPAVAPTVPPAAVPKAPATATTARPAPVSTSGRVVGGEE
jgi:hypothetical protein